MSRRRLSLPFAALGAALALLGGCGSDDHDGARDLPDAIRAVMAKPIYDKAVWGLRVVDRDSGEVLYDLDRQPKMLIASVRKSFSIGVALDALGGDHRFRTPVYRTGPVDAGGAVDGDLVLVASGDMSMGGRLNPDGSYAISDLDHNEANALMDAELTAPDPLAGYRALAAQIAASGITRVHGDVVVDERLWQKFEFRQEFQVSPLFVNDDLVDVAVTPGTAGSAAAVVSRPLSAAFPVTANVTTGAAGSGTDLVLNPSLPTCFGSLGCAGTVTGSVGVDAVGPLTGKLPLVRAFRITDPASYARTVLIEALAARGVTVDAPTVAPNDPSRLPATAGHDAASEVAALVSSPFADHARHVMKVSYNLGAEAALMNFGLARGVRTQAEALALERRTLVDQFGLDPAGFDFIDGSGDGETRASNETVTRLFAAMAKRAVFPTYLATFPVMGVDGSLGLVTGFAADPTLAGAVGQVQAKTGTFVGPAASEDQFVIRSQAFGGYIRSRAGRNLVYQLVVNDLQPVSHFDDLVGVIQDLGVISAVVWRDN